MTIMIIILTSATVPLRIRTVLTSAGVLLGGRVGMRIILNRSQGTYRYI